MSDEMKLVVSLILAAFIILICWLSDKARKREKNDNKLNKLIDGPIDKVKEMAESLGLSFENIPYDLWRTFSAESLGVFMGSLYHEKFGVNRNFSKAVSGFDLLFEAVFRELSPRKQKIFIEGMKKRYPNDQYFTWHIDSAINKRIAQKKVRKELVRERAYLKKL